VNTFLSILLFVVLVVIGSAILAFVPPVRAWWAKHRDTINDVILLVIVAHSAYMILNSFSWI